MFSFRMLLCALTLTLLAVTVESGEFLGTAASIIDTVDDTLDLLDPESEESGVHDFPVTRAEKVMRPIRSLRFAYGPISHSGVKVTLEDGSQWLIHKRDTGTDSQMVVTSAENMSSKWKSVETKEFNGRKTVGDFVKAGGDAYDVRRANCHHATDAMMNL
ncbi:uncharacterized protein LOC144464452 [Epinephelus lanceolatus]